MILCVYFKLYLLYSHYIPIVTTGNSQEGKILFVTSHVLFSFSINSYLKPVSTCREKPNCRCQHVLKKNCVVDTILKFVKHIKQIKGITSLIVQDQESIRLNKRRDLSQQEKARYNRYNIYSAVAQVIRAPKKSEKDMRM